MTDMRRELRRDLALPDGFVVESLRVLHELLGAAAFTSWGLGDMSARSIANHHRTLPTSKYDKYADIVFLAETVDIHEQRGSEPDIPTLWEEHQMEGSVDEAINVLARRPQGDR